MSVVASRDGDRGDVAVLSSETPWPAEPENTLGPIGETAAASGVPNEPEPSSTPDAGPTDNGPVKKQQPANQQTQRHKRRGPGGPGSAPF